LKYNNLLIFVYLFEDNNKTTYMKILGILVFSIFTTLYIFVIKAIFANKTSKVIAGSAVVLLSSFICYLTIVNPNPIEAPIAFLIIALLAFYFFVYPAIIKEKDNSINSKIREKVKDVIDKNL